MKKSIRCVALPIRACIVRSNPVTCHLYLIKRPKQHRIRKSVFGQPLRSNQSLKQARAQREPWLTGQQALAQGLQLHYQSNTRRTRPVLSLFNLACQLVRHTINCAPGRDMPILNLPDHLPLPPRTVL